MTVMRGISPSRHDAQFYSAGLAMTDFSDFCAQIAEYANRGDWAPAIVTGFVRQAEEKLNAELRIDRMIKFNEATRRLALRAVARRLAGDGARPDRQRQRRRWLHSDSLQEPG